MTSPQRVEPCTSRDDRTSALKAENADSETDSNEEGSQGSGRSRASSSSAKRDDTNSPPRATSPGVVTKAAPGEARPIKPVSSKRRQLIAEDAVEIFRLRPKMESGTSRKRGSMVRSKIYAPKYGVSAKTIR